MSILSLKKNKSSGAMPIMGIQYVKAYTLIVEKRWTFAVFNTWYMGQLKKNYIRLLIHITLKNQTARLVMNINIKYKNIGKIR